jgi:hypothetical protein
MEDSDVIKKILKHQNHWNLKRKLSPTANIPPIDVVATYDDLPEPSVDGYITDPNYSAEAYFKTTIEQQGFLYPTFRIFSQFITKFCLDNATGIRYLDPRHLLPQYGC